MTSRTLKAANDAIKSICRRKAEMNKKNTGFCAVCGAPLANEAVEIVMERLEELQDDFA